MLMLDSFVWDSKKASHFQDTYLANWSFLHVRLHPHVHKNDKPSTMASPRRVSDTYSQYPARIGKSPQRRAKYRN